MAFLAVLDRFTLADLVKNPGNLRAMRRLLGEPDKPAPATSARGGRPRL